MYQSDVSWLTEIKDIFHSIVIHILNICSTGEMLHICSTVNKEIRIYFFQFLQRFFVRNISNHYLYPVFIFFKDRCFKIVEINRWHSFFSWTTLSLSHETIHFSIVFCQQFMEDMNPQEACCTCQNYITDILHLTFFERSKRIFF